jgi:type I restriction enzyme S subunit
MVDKISIPKIRFKGFNGEWKEKVLDDISDVRDGTHNSPKYLLKGHPFITSKNVKSGQIVFDDIQYISGNDFNEINKRSKVDINDILMGMIGTIGNIALIRKEPNFAIKNVALIKDKNIVYCLYIYFYLQSSIIINQLYKSMEGGTQKFIALNKIRQLLVSIPKEEKEQMKIGNYFKQLDNLIEQKEKKYQKLKQFKKAMLDKMFPKKGANTPEICFEGFNGKWEEKKLGEVLEYIQPTKYLVNNTEYDNSYQTPVLTAGKTFVLGYTNETIGIFKENLPVIIFDDFTTAIKFVEFPFKAKSSAMKILIAKSNINIKFIYETMQIIKYDIGGHERHWISKFSHIPITVPLPDEQIKIGNYFQKLDKQIDLQLQEIEKLKNIKKASLDKMFV